MASEPGFSSLSGLGVPAAEPFAPVTPSPPFPDRRGPMSGMWVLTMVLVNYSVLEVSVPVTSRAEVDGEMHHRGN